MQLADSKHAPKDHSLFIKANNTLGMARLNPQVAGFQPTGSEVQRYQAADLPTPPQSDPATPGQMVQLQRFMVDQQFNHTADVARLERETKQNSEDNRITRETVTHDLRALQNQIEDMKAVVANFSAKDLVAADEPEFTVPADLPETRSSSHTQLCCGKLYYSILEWVEHVNVSHGKKKDTRQGKFDFVFDEEKHKESISSNEDGQETPTHCPIRRAHTMEVKTPIEEYNNKANDEQGSDEATPTPEETKVTSTSLPEWQPLAVRQMPVLSADTHVNPEGFSWELLTFQLSGSQWSPGFYHNTNADISILPNKGYWLLEAEFEPCIPSSPTANGAKLTAFFNDTDSPYAPGEDAYLNAPVFVRAEGCSEYKYFGNYSQTRFSDKLDYDHLQEMVPRKVRQYWADQLADRGRPEWIAKALMEHFWPRPQYEGPLPSELASGTTEAGTVKSGPQVMDKCIQKVLGEFAFELKEWEEEARMKVNHITAEGLMESFGFADADEEKGLRLWWEFLQCVEYDFEFYESLVELKEKEKQKVAAAQATRAAKVEAANAQAANTQAAAPNKTKPTGTVVKPTHSIETVTVENVPAPGTTMSRAKVPEDNTKKPAPVGHYTGDMNVAKQLQEQFKTGGRHHTTNRGSRAPAKRQEQAKFVPPHMR